MEVINSVNIHELLYMLKDTTVDKVLLCSSFAGVSKRLMQLSAGLFANSGRQ